MKLILKYTIAILALFSIQLSYAIDSPTWVNVDSTSDSSITLSWDAVENAFMYYVYYGTESAQVSNYDSQTDFIDGTSTEVTGLESGTTYYFTAVAIDENGEESMYSSEVSATVGWAATNNDTVEENFILEWVEIKWSNKIALDFSSPLEAGEDAIREFKITNKNDSLDSFEVVESEIDEEDNTMLEVTLDRDVEIGNEYDIVIIAINSAAWSTIESGIDSSETLVVSEIPEEEMEEEMVQIDAPVETTADDMNEENSDMNAASDGPTWELIAAETVENTTLSVAENNDSLPKTGPEHIFILILSIILTFSIFAFRFKQ